MQTIDKLPHVRCWRKIIARNVSLVRALGCICGDDYIDGGGAGSDTL